MWKLPKKFPRARAKAVPPMQLPNPMGEEGCTLPCHQHKGQVETATDMYSPWVDFAKSPCVYPFPRPLTSLGMSPLSSSKLDLILGLHF